MNGGGDALGGLFGLVILAAIGAAIYFWMNPDAWSRFQVDHLNVAGTQFDVGDCVTRNAPNSPAANIQSGAIVRGCRERYARPIPSTYFDPNVTGSLNRFAGAQIHNNGRDYIITELTFSIFSMNGATPPFARSVTATNLWIAPLTTEAVYPSIPEDTQERMVIPPEGGQWQWGWNITAAKGVRFVIR